ncbi:MAG TPA: hypothetical protein VN577_02365 [Terriglobales bacterium]|nr:hypothetical protein [Terriglobales bacterium]
MAAIINRCEYIRDNNTQCGSPALRGRHLCYYHSRVRYVPRRNGKPVIQLTSLETSPSMQIAALHVAQAVLTGDLDPARANAALRAVQIAFRTLKSYDSSVSTKEHDLPESMLSMIEDVRQPAQAQASAQSEDSTSSSGHAPNDESEYVATLNDYRTYLRYVSNMKDERSKKQYADYFGITPELDAIYAAQLAQDPEPPVSSPLGDSAKSNEPQVS